MPRAAGLSHAVSRCQSSSRGAALDSGHRLATDGLATTTDGVASTLNNWRYSAHWAVPSSDTR